MAHRSRRQRAVGLALAAGLTSWLAVHYALVALYVLPDNPISVVHSEGISRYVEPFFVQRWSLFAPRPPLDNDRYLLQLSVLDRATGAARHSEWLDVGTPLLERLRRNPLSPATYQFRTIEGVYRAFFNLEARRRADDSYQLTAQDTRLIATLRRLLTALANRVVSDTGDYALLAVRGRVVREPIPPFSEHATRDYEGELASATFDWMPPDFDLTGHSPVEP